MRIQNEQKHSLICYLLEKFKDGDTAAVRKTAEAFETSPATVYKYVDELIEEHIVQKLARGHYALTKTSKAFELNRSAGELCSEHTVFETKILPEIADLPKNAVDSWAYIFSEMMNNIIDHSNAETVEILLERDYLYTSILLLDDGVGIFEKIKNYFGLPSVVEAVGELFKGKLTTDAENHTGEGIFFSSRLADRFFILSSDKIFSHEKFSAEDILHELPLEPLKEGTLVFASLSNLTKKTPVDIFDEFAAPEAEFTFSKTRIPIRSYFESAPVSRSQAKRLTVRLTEFREVELDFSGVEWMGQGFAHQLFVVFQKANPETSLLPINMNESVEKMYRHVMQ